MSNEGSNAQAIYQALAFLGRPANNGEAPSQHTQVPTAVARRAIEGFSSFGDYDAYNATWPNLKAMLTDALNWHGEPRATKAVTKALTRAMNADLDGHTTYAAAIEMISFLSLCAPLVEPDRLARIAERAAHTRNAYRPMRFLVKPAAQLKAALEPYTEARREQLLISLWDLSHDGHWWRHTTGGQDALANRQRERRLVTAAERRVIAQQMAELVGTGNVPTVESLTEAFRARCLTQSTAVRDAIATMRMANRHERLALASFATDPDADVRSLLSCVRELQPDERPESPIETMIDMLARAREDMTDVAAAERPETWSDLYPEESTQSFPMGAALRRAFKDWVPFPGAEVFLIKNAAALRRNGDHMGNCTYTYVKYCQDGRTFIGYMVTAEGDYNFAIDAHGDGTYSVGEINSRFNRGHVPEHVSAAIQQHIATIVEAA